MSSAPQSDGSGSPVLCYDGSEYARRAIRAAGRILEGRSVVVLHAWETGPAVPYIQTDDRRLAEEGERVSAEGAALAAEAGMRPSPMPVPSTGPLRQAILDAIEEHDPLLVVVGARGLSGIKSALLGSISNYLVHHCHSPVLVVPPSAEAEPS